MKPYEDPFPYTKHPLEHSLRRTHHDVKQFFGTLPLDIFWMPLNEGWSPAENLKHLIKSVQPVVLALKLPRPLLGLLFGRSDRISRRYEDIRSAYRDKLAEGFQAPWAYLPGKMSAARESPEPGRYRLLQQWDRVCEALVKSIGKWHEADLDRYRLPHPSLGKISVREVLLFTLYHNEHHMQSVRSKLAVRAQSAR